MSNESVMLFKVGDGLLRLREEDAGRVFTVIDVDPPYMNTRAERQPGDRHTPWAMGLISTFTDAEEWRRVPPGYTVPPVADLLAGIARLVAARDKMAADPETGTRGVWQCIDEMAVMAGIEVGT